MRAECMRSQYSRGKKEVMGVSPADCKSRLVGWEVANTSKKGFTKVSRGDGDRESDSGFRGECLEVDCLKVPQVEAGSGRVR